MVPRANSIDRPGEAEAVLAVEERRPGHANQQETDGIREGERAHGASNSWSNSLERAKKPATVHC